MASFDVLRTYVEPCLSERHTSIESIWLSPSNFGECYPPPSDSLLYPRLTPVYNGKLLDIEPELVHSGLSGISIKHYYGKCFLEEERNILYGEQSEMYDYEWIVDRTGSSVSPGNGVPSVRSTETDRDLEHRRSWHDEGQPLCTLPNINCRNSFWNIHKPEMCKLTWGQTYVSAATVIEHLHEHLSHHGPLCRGFHTEEDRNIMLNKELDEYVRLKVLLCPKELPPEEPLYNFKKTPSIPKGVPHPSCKTRLPPEITEVINDNERYLPLSDDEETADKRIHRSKEEFCVTIGKHIHKTPVLTSTTVLQESYTPPEISFGEEESAFGKFYYDWYLYDGEEYLDKFSDNTESNDTNTLSEADAEPKLDDPFKLSEFCRGVGKVDYNDFQSKPDF